MLVFYYKNIKNYNLKNYMIADQEEEEVGLQHFAGNYFQNLLKVV